MAGLSFVLIVLLIVLGMFALIGSSFASTVNSINPEETKASKRYADIDDGYVIMRDGTVRYDYEEYL